MTLQELIKIQMEFDKKHGWAIDHDQSDLGTFLDSLSDDILGLVGEVGELANIVKKIKLELKSLGSDTTNEQLPAMSEEFVDILIYVVRISMHLNIDIEKEYLKKLNKNKIKFKKYE